MRNEIDEKDRSLREGDWAPRFLSILVEVNRMPRDEQSSKPLA